MNKNNLAIKTYEKIAQKYSDLYFNDTSDFPFVDIFLEKLPSNGSILEVGSGPGQFSLYMTKKGFQVTGIDYTKEMVKVSRRNVPNVQFKYMDMKHLEFENEQFDGLLAAYSLIHIPSEDIPNTLQGFNRVLKPGGYLQIIAQHGEADIVQNEPFMPTETTFNNFFTVERLEKFLEAAEFTVVYKNEIKTADPDAMSERVIYMVGAK